jgi:hypothetical protein
MNPRFQRLMDLLTAVTFGALVLLPTVLAPLVDSSRSFAMQAEQREVAPWPGRPRGWADWKAFPDRFDAWLADHFGLRRQLIHAHSRLLYSVFRTSPSAKVILGRDGWMFLKGDPAVDGDPISDYRGTLPLIPYELERWRWQLQDEHDWVTSRGMYFMFALVGSKEWVHSEKLPYYITNVGHPTSRHQFLQHVEPRLNFPVVDLTHSLMDAKRARVMYRLTDTHWNHYGSLAGIRGLIAALQPRFPALQPPPETNIVVTSSIQDGGDLSRLMGLEDVVKEPFVQLGPRTPRAVITPVPGTRLNDTIARVADTNLPTALFFHDSFGLYMKPLFSECFEELRFRWSNYGLEVGQFRDFRPDIVIHMNAERRLRLSQRVETPIQQECNARYFAASSNRLASWTTPDEWAALAAQSPGATATATGLVLAVKSGEARLRLPPLDDMERLLPIVAIDLATDVRATAALRWDTRYPARWPVFLARDVDARIEPGGYRVHLPLYDPETTGAITLAVGRLSEPCHVRSIEIRGVPRDVPVATEN